MKPFTLILLLLLFALTPAGARNEQQNIAYADHNVRFTVISDGTLRLEYAPDGTFVDDRSFIAVSRLYPPVHYKVKAKGPWIEIATSRMTLRYKKGSGPFAPDNLEIRAAKGTFPFCWKPGTQQKGNLKGTYRTLDGMDGDTQTQTWVADSKKGDRLKLEDGLLATDGWTLIDDSRGLLFDGDADWDWVRERPDNGGQDWYFMAYGHDYKQALKDYTLFAGRMPLPPRYAFGYWWSRYWLYSDREIRNLIDNFHTYQIPLDVLVVDMDWHYTEKGKGGWTGWTWNRDLFPNPQGFLDYLNRNNVKVTLNLHPADGVAAYEEAYPAMARAMGLDPATKQTIPWVNSDKRFMTNIFRHVLAPMEEDGVSFWWLDWQQGMFDPKLTTLSNTWWINYAFFSDMERRRPTRPMLYHRWGGLGNHRYQVGFSGDAVISWKSLEFQPYFNSTASNVLYGYWSHDLGGHIGSRIDPEMYTRWLQFGALSPIMRTHSQKGAELNKEPWVFSKEYADVIRSTIRQRYVMSPYIYTMARKGYDEGLSLCRPLYYDYPESKEAYDFRSEYMFGDDMLVAPVTSPAQEGYARVRVWLPEGEWYEWHTGALLQGNRIVERPFAIDEYPLYVKAGAILPLCQENIMNLSANDTELTVALFPGGEGTSSSSLYEDNGDDKRYASEYTLTPLSATRNGNEQTIRIGKREGSYQGMPLARAFKVKVLSSSVPQSVTVNGIPAQYSYSTEDFALLVELPELPCDQEKLVRIVYPSEPVDLNGLKGASRRVARSMEQLKYRQSYIVFKEELGKMGSLNEAVMYAPSELPALVAGFWKSYHELPSVLERQGLKSEQAAWFLQSVGWEGK